VSFESERGLVGQGTGLLPVSLGSQPGGYDSEVPLRQIGQWRLVWLRFKRHRLALIGAWVALAMILLVLLGPLFAPPLVQPDKFGQLPLWAYRRANEPPTLRWPFTMGTDGIGNPVVSFFLTGGRPMLAIGFLGALLASLLGVVVGGVAGYFAGVVDAVLMRLVDVVLAVPFLLFLIMLSGYLTDRGVLTYIALFGLVGWPGVARLVRGYVLSLREREFAEAARALGVSPWGVILRHLLPNALDVIVVSLTLNVSLFMVTDATLDFLGAGVRADTETWGDLLGAAYSGYGLLNGYWWLAVFPGAALLLTVLAVNFLGDGLRDALDATSPTALITETPQRAREPGRLAVALLAVGHRLGMVRHSLGAAASRPLAAAGRRRPITRIRQSLPRLDRERQVERSGQREGARRVRYPLRAARAARRPFAVSLPLPLRLAPIIAAFGVVGVVFLYGHSPLRYAPNFSGPATYAQVYGESQYAAWPRRRGGWDIFALDGHGRVAYRRIDVRGRTVLDQVLTSTFGADQLSMAKSVGQTLGAWVGNNGQTIYTAFLGKRRSHVFPLNSPGGAAEDPDVVPVGKGFAVLFDWQRPSQSAYDIYLASIPAGAGRLAESRIALRRLVPTRDYGTDPRAVVDGSGKLDLIYLRRIDADRDIWSVLFQRFTVRGRSLGRPRGLGDVNLLEPGANGCNLPDGAPTQWAIDIKRAANGSVWGAWEYGTDCVSKGGISGNNTLSIAHWSRTGHLLLPPAVVDPGVDASSEVVALALQRHGGQLYSIQPGAIVPYLQSTGFTAQGQPLPPERVNYDGGAKLANPVARSVGGRPAVLWERIRVGGASLEGTSYHPSQPPDLLTRLGLNIGTLWGNLALILFGSLGAGIALTLVNVFLLLPLISVWLVVRRLTGSLRWPLYLGAIAVLLVWVFALHSSLPSYVLVLPSLVSTPLGTLDAWLMVGGAVFVSGWSGTVLLQRQESAVRATAMALIGLYFVTVMYAVLFVQSQLSQL